MNLNVLSELREISLLSCDSDADQSKGNDGVYPMQNEIMKPQFRAFARQEYVRQILKKSYTCVCISDVNQ